MADFEKIAQLCSKGRRDQIDATPQEPASNHVFWLTPLSKIKVSDQRKTSAKKLGGYAGKEPLAEVAVMGFRHPS